MPLPSGAHVKIGDDEFIIDESVEDHYVHSYEPVLENDPEIQGEEGKRHIRRDRLMWSMTDWGGGEGNRLWYPDDPLVYDYSDGLNGRIRGQLTGRPSRTVTSVPWADQRDRPTMEVADGSLWLGGSQSLKESTDGSTWTNRTSGIVSPARIMAMAGDHEYLYYTSWEFTDSGTRRLRRTNSDNSPEDVVSSATGRAVYAGMTIMGGRLYAWTGRKLFEHDIFESVPLASDKIRKVYDTGVDPANQNAFSAEWWADAIPTENSVIFFYSTAAQSNVYEYRNGVGRPIWHAPYGFTIKAAVYQNGVVFLAGHWGGDSNAAGHGAMYALPLDSRRPVFVNWFRKHQAINLQMQEVANSYGSQILVAAANTGRIFVYDADLDGLSMLDDLENDAEVAFVNNDDRIGHMATYGNKRVIAVYHKDAADAGTAIYTVSYADEEPGNRQSSLSGGLSTSLEMGEHDFNLPFDVKTLLAFHVTFKPLTTNQRIRISYKWDLASSWTDMDWITSATTGNSEGRVIQNLTTPTKGYRLKVKITLDTNGATGVLQPILYGATAEAEAINYEEIWDLAVRVKNENQTNARPSDRSWLAEVIRDKLFTIAQNKVAITFLDGYRYSSRPNKTSTHTVTIKQVQDVIETQPAEGTFHVKLKAVPT